MGMARFVSVSIWDSIIRFANIGSPAIKQTMS